MDQKVAMGSSASGDDHSKLNNTTLNNNKFKFNNDEKVKSWEYSYGCSWPPRSHYKCSFCRREFKSAQALGGHMNVHRRDRAKFRSNPSSSPPPPPSPSFFNPNYEIAPPNPNPNPNLYNPSDLTLSISPSSSSLATTSIYAHQYSLVSLSLSCLSTSPSSSFLANGVNLGGKFRDSSSNFKGGFTFKDEDEKDGGVKLDLELGLIRDTKKDDQDLDLELRLGT